MRTLLHIIALLLLVNSAQAKEVFEASKESCVNRVVIFLLSI